MESVLCTTGFTEVSNSKPSVCCEYVSVRWVRETEGETQMGKRETHRKQGRDRENRRGKEKKTERGMRAGERVGGGSGGKRENRRGQRERQRQRGREREEGGPGDSGEGVGTALGLEGGLGD